MGNHLYLKKNLIRFQCHASISMYKYLNDYNKLLVDLQNLEININSEVKALLLLKSLPNTDDHLIATLLYGESESYHESFFFFFSILYFIISHHVYT